jgi:hypothetical protein
MVPVPTMWTILFIAFSCRPEAFRVKAERREGYDETGNSPTGRAWWRAGFDP